MLFDPFLSEALTCVHLLSYASLTFGCANVRPARARLYAMALESDELWKTRAAPVHSVLSLDLSPFDRLMQVLYDMIQSRQKNLSSNKSK